MIIIGAGSAGKEALGILISQNETDNLMFFDENPDSTDLVFDKFPVIKCIEELKKELEKDNSFCAAIGNPRKRKKLFDLLLLLGGKPKNIVYSKTPTISEFAENGTIIQPHVSFSFDVKFGNSCLFHCNSTIGHKVRIGDFVNISPLCSLIGPCEIGNETFIGAGSIILPDIIIGNNVFIPPGSIVNRNLSNFETF